MSLFKLAQYSALIFLIKRDRSKIYRWLSIAVFILISYWLVSDLEQYVAQAYPAAMLYWLVGKALLLYLGLAVLLWQLRPRVSAGGVRKVEPARSVDVVQNNDRLEQFRDLSTHAELPSRSQQVVDKKRS
jgi:apolipoprotein N-acyltransferase